MSITAQCEALDISRSSAYYTEQHTKHDHDVATLLLVRNVLSLRPFYGYRKVALEISKSYIPVTGKQIRRIMAKAGLKAIYPGLNLSKSRQEHMKYPYLLAGKEIRYPNQVWATDITYIKTAYGHMYLLAIIDVFSRKVLNWILTNSLDAQLFANCLRETMDCYGVPAILNTDQGCQFTSECWTKVLLDAGVRISMDGKNRALDNIYIERLWRSLKYEDIYIKHYETVKELKAGIAKYFRFYNEERFHQSLEYRTPDEMYESFQAVGLATSVA